MNRVTIRLFTVAFLLLGGSTLAAAAQGGRNRQMPGYDKTTEITIRGEVTDLTAQTGSRGSTGVHATLTVDGAPVVVHFGPATYLEEQHLNVTKGDVIEVVGSKVTHRWRFDTRMRR